MTDIDSTPEVPLKQCSRKEKCVNPAGCRLPATTEYFSKDSKERSGLKSRCKACVSAYQKQYRLENPDKGAAIYQRYKNKHRDEILERRQKWRKEHQEEERERGRLYAATHQEQRHEYYVTHKSEWRENQQELRRNFPERRREYEALYRITHKDQIRISNKTYYVNHPEVSRKNAHHYRLRKRNASGEFSANDVLVLLKTQKRRCWWCGQKIVGNCFHLDHRIPLTRGGSNNPENLCVSCPSCNLSKGNKLPQEWNGRLL